MNNTQRKTRSNTRALTGSVVKDNHIFAIIVRENDSWFISSTAHYYRRRTSFAGVFTGTYEEAQRLAKISVHGE